jgi:hypothetical protein
VNGWAFTKARDGWRWLSIDTAGNLVKTSPRPLRSLIECVRDAMKHGYSIALGDLVRAPDDLRQSRE